MTVGYVPGEPRCILPLRVAPAESRAKEQKAGQPDGPAAQGFTLTEMLVVVSIICLLFSVLLPSFNKAMKKSEQTHCLANQRQLYLTWTLYSTNNNDELCSSLDRLKRYADANDIFLCRAAAKQVRYRFQRSPSYGLSNTVGGSFRDGVTPYERFHKITRVTDTLVFADIEANDSMFWPVLRDSQRKCWLWRPPDIQGLAGLTNRHGDGCNMTFADGHGEMVRWKDPRTVALIKGTLADEVGASRGNTDLDYLVRVLVGSRPVQDSNETTQ